MKKQATVIHHGGGFFLAIDGDLNKREVIINGFVKGLSTVKQYYRMISKKDGTGYTSYDYAEQAIATPIDLTNKVYPPYITVDDLWDPNRNFIDKETGELIQTMDEAVDEIKEGLVELEEGINKTKNLMEIMKANQDKSNKRSEAAKRAAQTRKANLLAKIEAEKAKEAMKEKQLIRDYQLASTAFRNAIRTKQSANAEKALNTMLEIVPQLSEGKRKDKYLYYLSMRKKELAELKDQLLDNVIEVAWDEVVDDLNASQADDDEVQDFHDSLIDEKRNEEYQEFIKIQANDVAPAPEATQTINNSQNTDEMNTNANSVNNAPENKVSFSKSRKIRRGIAKGAEVAIVVTTDIGIAGSIAIADFWLNVAEGLAWSQAAAIKPLGLHPDATRADLKQEALDRAQNRLETVYSVPKTVVAIPSKIMAMQRAKREMTDAQYVNVPQQS